MGKTLLLAQPVSVLARIKERERERSKGLTSHEKVESISNITLVAGEVNTTTLGSLFLLIVSKLGAERDTSAQDDASVFLVWLLVRFLVAIDLQIWGIAGVIRLGVSEFSLHEVVVIAKITLMVGSRAHLAGVCGKWASHDALLGSKIKVVSEGQTRVIMIGSQSHGGT